VHIVFVLRNGGYLLLCACVCVHHDSIQETRDFSLRDVIYLGAKIREFAVAIFQLSLTTTKL